MRHFFNIEFKFLKQCLFIGFLILLPQILAELFFTHIIWNISFSVVSTVLITGYIYYLFNRVKTDVEYISDKVESSYLESNEFENITRRFEDRYIQDLSRRFNDLAEHLNHTVDNLSKEKTKLAAVLDTMADGVIVLDKEGIISLVNQSALVSFQIKLESFERVKFIELVRDHEIQKIIDQCLENTEISVGEVEMSNGGFFNVLAIPLLSTDKLINEGVLITFHDISRFRQLENTRREFVANVSHELRNPLAGIKALTETLENFDDLDKNVRGEFIDRINEDVDRMTNLTNDLLELSKLESGQVKTNIMPVEIVLVFKSLNESFSKEYHDKGVALDFKSVNPSFRILSEFGMLIQVFTNLLENSLRFTRKGDFVTVSCKENKETISIVVADNGIGIDKEHLPHVFERFYKAERSRSDGGTGLGLSIVKHIVGYLNGEVLINSEIGVGTNVEVVFKKI